MKGTENRREMGYFLFLAVSRFSSFTYGKGKEGKGNTYGLASLPMAMERQ